MKKVDSMQDEMDNFSREVESVRKKQMKKLETNKKE